MSKNNIFKLYKEKKLSARNNVSVSVAAEHRQIENTKHFSNKYYQLISTYV